MKIRKLWMLPVAVMVLAVAVVPAAWSGDWSVTSYGARLTRNSFGDTLKAQAKYEDSYLAALAVSRRVGWLRPYLGPVRDHLGLEIEGQVVKHFEDQKHVAFNGLFVLRWQTFPWDRFLDTSLAVGEGLSYAVQSPVLEDLGDPNSPNWLNYIMLELAVSLPDYPRWGLVARLHHRSGVFGLFSGMQDASNAVGLGLCYHF